ncbi:MAG: pectic acid lyase [Planctomycetota bacterium]|nr:MAG: pectic acid lyase [Planctomycetota bacterium]
MQRLQRAFLLLAPAVWLFGCGGGEGVGVVDPAGVEEAAVVAAPAGDGTGETPGVVAAAVEGGVETAASVTTAASELEEEAVEAMRRAGAYYYENVARHGGYVYFYSLDLSVRWGEGLAGEDQIWVQPPGTPTVGLAFLEAWRATGDEYYRKAATEAAEALAYGQLQSGGWTNSVDFDPNSGRTGQYRNGRGRGKNNSSLDDGQTQSAIRLMVQADAAHEFRHAEIHESAQIALEALLAAQFPNGAFPQVWTGPVEAQPVLAASYPDYDWRTEGRIKEYWDMYTLNDNVCGYVAEALIDAHEVYGDEKYLEALTKLGDFLILAQMPDPQPGWAQQYNYEMKPIWARKFEPPGVAGDETQEAIATLMLIAAETGDAKYLEPIPRALAWLRESALDDGRLARFYELETNRPLYMFRRGKVYTLTYDDSDLPGHYGWKIESRLDELEARYRALTDGDLAPVEPVPPSEAEVRRIIASLDDEGRWLKTFEGERLVGQGKFPIGEEYLSSELFSENMTTLSRFVGR